MGELIMLRLEDQVLKTLLHEALNGVVTKVSSRKGLQQSFTKIYTPVTSWATSGPAG